MKILHGIAFALVVIGALNWLLVGAFDWNLVMWLLGVGIVAKAVYVLVGLSAILLVVTHKKDCKCCDKSAAPAPMA